MAHAVVNAALAAAQGSNIAAGAAGGMAGELTGMLAEEIYRKQPGEMTETERQTVSALATLAAGLSGGLVGESSQDVIAAAQAGKVTVENNVMGGCSPVTCKQGLDVIGGGVSSSFGGGMIGGGAGVGLAAVIGEIFGGDSDDVESKPNAVKNLTDAEKIEYGGTGSGTPDGWDPQDEENARDKELSASDRRSIKSLEDQMKAHEDKLTAYKRNPDAFDNQRHLKNAPSDAVRQRIIDGRVRHLEHEIRTFQENINKIRNGKE